MFLLVSATDMEMQSVSKNLKDRDGLFFSVTGLGPVETTLRLASFLHGAGGKITGVINFGVAGAYPEKGLAALDICLADKEILGDLGICFDGHIEPFGPHLSVNNEFPLTNNLLAGAVATLAKKNISFVRGTFVTVNCASGTSQRGQYMRDAYGAICENMEGAAVARVCREFAIPCLELRCVSNLVEDRDLNKWQLEEARQKCGEVISFLLPDLINF